MSLAWVSEYIMLTDQNLLERYKEFLAQKREERREKEDSIIAVILWRMNGDERGGNFEKNELRIEYSFTDLETFLNYENQQLILVLKYELENSHPGWNDRVGIISSVILMRMAKDQRGWKTAISSTAA